MRIKHIGILLLTSALVGCVSQKQGRYKDQPPKFLGLVYENMTARYNAYYNANFIYESSLFVSEDGFQENFAEELPVSVPDAVAKSGSMGGDMQTVIEKTSRVIDRRPYSKWVDDNYLLNGIAHYVNGEYSKAEEIFLYTTSEYKNGVNYDRVGARQRVKSAEFKKKRREEEKKRQEEYEQKLKEQEEERKAKLEDRKNKIKEREDRIKEDRKNKKRLSRDEQFKAKQKAKKEGKKLSTEEVLEKIKKDQDKRDRRGEKISEEDLELLDNAPTAVNDNADNPGFLKHPLAAKDAMLWLAKTYITQEKFIAANAVLTAINEDETFPNRLNEEYYLTYADMYIRLNNYTKATEYIQLAIEDSKRRDKGRLYFVLGQTYLANGQEDLAQQAFATVRQYHPHYDMIYHAEMNVLAKDFKDGKFNQEDFTKKLRKMSLDAKNLDFLSQVYYYLGEAYLAQNEKEKAIEALENSLEESEFSTFSHGNTYFTLANAYYEDKNYKSAQENYQSASDKIEDNLLKEEAKLYANSLETIIDGFATIHIKDSLLALGELPSEELQKFIEKKVDKDLKALRKQQLDSLNQAFGGGTRTSQRPNRRNDNNQGSGEFYFYDIQQTVNGFSEFRQTWGDRPNVDGWRRQATVSRSTSNRNLNNQDKKDKTKEKELSKLELIQQYLNEVPVNQSDRRQANETIIDSYVAIIETFIFQLGEFDRAEQVIQELSKRELNGVQQNELMRLKSELNRMKNVDSQESVSNRNWEQIGNPEEENQLIEADNEKLEEIYTETYELFQKEKWEEALTVAKQAEEFEGNKYADRFTYITALCEKETSAQSYLRKLQTFESKFPNSPLLPEVNKLLGKK